MDGQGKQENRWRHWLIAVVLVSATALVANADETSDVKRTGRGRVAPTSNPINLTVTTDRQAYNVGQTIHITANAVYNDGSPVKTTKKTVVEIKDGDRRRVLRGALNNQGSGAFTYSYTTASNATPGSWEIEVEVEDQQRNKAEKKISVEVTTGSPPPSTSNSETMPSGPIDSEAKIRVEKRWTGPNRSRAARAVRIF